MGVPWLLAMVLVLAALLAGPGAGLVASRLERRTRMQPGWWASPQEQERLSRILARNPSYDERTGLTSDRELAQWWRENQP